MATVETKHTQILYPTVRVMGKEGGGSGTVLYSDAGADGKVRTFVLTNHHVIASLLKIDKKWDSRLGKEVKKDVRATAEVHFFKYNNLSRCVGSFAVEADVVAYEPDEDMAILELRDRENKAEHVATIIPEEEMENVHIFDEIYAAGATLLHPPFATHGEITHQDDEIDNRKYWLGSALISFGNSGGAVFRLRKGKYEFIGVPSRVQLQGFGDVANWMGYFIPPHRVVEFFKNQGFEFLFDKNETVESCEKRRKEAADKDRTLMEQEEGVVVDANEGD